MHWPEEERITFRAYGENVMFKRHGYYFLIKKSSVQ